MQDLLDAIAAEPDGTVFVLDDCDDDGAQLFSPFTRLERKYGVRPPDTRVLAVAYALYRTSQSAHYAAALGRLSPLDLGYGSLLLARHLCGRGRGPFWDEPSVLAMAVLDRVIQNERASLVRAVCVENPAVSWKVMWRIDEFYVAGREWLPPLPSTEEEYEAVPTEEDYEAGRAKRPEVNLLDFTSTVGVMF